MKASEQLTSLDLMTTVCYNFRLCSFLRKKSEACETWKYTVASAEVAPASQHQWLSLLLRRLKH